MKSGIQIGMIVWLIVASVSSPNAASAESYFPSQSRGQLPIIILQGGPGPACTPDGQC